MLSCFRNRGFRGGGTDPSPDRHHKTPIGEPIANCQPTAGTRWKFYSIAAARYARRQRALVLPLLLKRRLGRRGRRIWPRTVAARAWPVIGDGLVIWIGPIIWGGNVRPRPPAPTRTPSPAWGPPSAPSWAAPASAWTRTPVRTAKMWTTEMAPLNLCCRAVSGNHAGARWSRIGPPSAAGPGKRYEDCCDSSKSELSHSVTPSPRNRERKLTSC
jgi:hypothetical protein